MTDEILDIIKRRAKYNAMVWHRNGHCIKKLEPNAEMERMNITDKENMHEKRREQNKRHTHQQDE